MSGSWETLRIKLCWVTAGAQMPWLPLECSLSRLYSQHLRDCLLSQFTSDRKTRHCSCSLYIVRCLSVCKNVFCVSLKPLSVSWTTKNNQDSDRHTSLCLTSQVQRGAFFQTTWRFVATLYSASLISAIFLTAFPHFVSLWHILVIHTIFQTFSLLWWSVNRDLWRYYCNCFVAPQTTPM